MMMSECSSDLVISQQHAARLPPIALGINVEKPKFPQYAVFAERFKSFREWPKYLPVDKLDLVEAGLVYTGIGDSVRCYFCGGGLRNWEQDDVPIEEHAKWYPKCPHILLVKGQAYVEKLGRGGKPDVEEVGNNEQASIDDKHHLKTAAVLSCIDMGFSEVMVKKAIKIFIENHGSNNFKGGDLCKILFDLEEGQDEANFEEQLDECSPDECEEIEPLETLQEENRKLKEKLRCKRCMVRFADVIFLPCGHMISCPQCAPALTKCRLCGETVNGHIKAFFATASMSQKD